ncbi:MAG: hypothetical protein ETSY2_43485 [Candidatus Entotheonella gemina]|uniref:Uncharacterized protein n=1 Tax=Candidatus Entotheonella gemina TaxID=1429439 RepID=W4LIU6_9BACT|nr:MAG: hypothetical protein ETSY2_43485 [Candidatus Entotheonella gemina]
MHLIVDHYGTHRWNLKDLVSVRTWGLTHQFMMASRTRRRLERNHLIDLIHGHQLSGLASVPRLAPGSTTTGLAATAFA